MWPSRDKEISELTLRVALLESDLSTARLEIERERSARLVDRLEAIDKMESIREELVSSVSGLRGKREKPTIAFRNARDFRAAVELEEKIDA